MWPSPSHSPAPPSELSTEADQEEELSGEGVSKEGVSGLFLFVSHTPFAAGDYLI